jgi:hypothetical protein
LKRALAGKLDARFHVTETAKLAAALHPGVRVTMPQEELEAILFENTKTVQFQPKGRESSGQESTMLAKVLKSMMPTSSQEDENMSEVRKYLAHTPAPENIDDALSFWEKNANMFPRLSKLAEEYLAISCSSVPVECMFSSTGLVMNSKRCRLDAISLNMITFVHDNVKQVDF